MNKIDFLRHCISYGSHRRYPDQGKSNLLTITAFLAFLFYLPYASFAQDPLLSGIEASIITYTEGQGSVSITTSLTATDADSPLLSNATVQISTNYSSTEDVLNFTDAFSITGSYDAATGTLTLTGPASPDDFTTALRSVTYENLNNNNPSSLARTISFSVFDGSTNSIIVTRDVQVNGVNDPPSGQPDSFVIYEDTELDCGCLLINDTDPDGDDLVALHGDPPLHGIVTDMGGFFIYTPNPDYYGTDSFTYHANDGTENSAPIVVHVTILPVNDPPVAANDAFTTDEDTSVTLPLLSNDNDVDDVLSASMIVLTSTPDHGSVTINATTGVVSYTPNLNYNGADSFTYQVKDASGALSNVATVVITIHPVNDAPNANPDLATTPEETQVSVAVLDNDTDIDSSLDPASVLVSSLPAHGVAVVEQATGIIVYTPEENFNGVDSFTYTVKDAEGATSAPALVTITVSPINDPPVAVNDQAETDENIAVEIKITVNDYDVDDEIVISSVTFTTNPSHGTITFNNTTGVVVYIPEKGFTGTETFSYTIRDPDGLTSEPGIITIAVIDAPNQPPIAVDDGPIANSSVAPLVIDVLANDHDDDNDHEELSIVSVTAPSVGTVQIVDGKIVYQPAGLISSSVTFTYTIEDPDGLSDEAEVTIENTYLPLIVSEGFSPNGNDNNETWYIQGIENYPNNFVKVFDRWGLLVYQKEHYENFSAPWDGRGNTAQQSGKLLDQGTYYYILEPGDEMKTMTGYVVIIR
ncbi:MAG TPA: Ig-like domain-containing protein [Chryseolinea sp.]